MTRIGKRAIIALGLFGFIASGSVHAETKPAEVKFKDGTMVEQSLTGKPGDAANGRKVFANRKLGNCLACHVNSDLNSQSFHGEVGPPLDGVAGRYEEAELRAIVVDSKKAITEDTIMPAFYSLNNGVRVHKKFEGKTILSAQQVEDVVAYLRTLKE